MNLRAISVASTVAIAGVACGPQGRPSDEQGIWVGTFTTEGSVTTVVNESGSVWGGPATLVEEASIGVESGAGEYMFGGVAGVWATGDRIFVLDSQIPTVRVYDFGGEHLFDVGRRGQGPGEFTSPAGVALADNGDILVVETGLQVHVFAPDGTPKETWNTGSATSVGTTDMLLIGSDGAVWVRAFSMERRLFGHAKIGDDKQAGEPVFPPDLGWEPPCLTYMRNGREDRYCNIPFQPFVVRVLTPDGGWAIGINDAYSFEAHSPNGTVLRVERYWDPVPVTAAEAANRKKQTSTLIRDRAGDTSWTWNGPEIPGHKPAYLRLFPEHNGRVWVLPGEDSNQSSH